MTGRKKKSNFRKKWYSPPISEKTSFFFKDGRKLQMPFLEPFL